MDSDDENFGDWEEDEHCDVQGLLSKQIYPSVNELLQKEKERFSFDLVQIINDAGGFDDIGMIMLVNFIRQRVGDASTVDTAFVTDISSCIRTKSFISSEQYMKPVLKDDPLLFLLGETLLKYEEGRDSPETTAVEDQQQYAFLQQVQCSTNDMPSPSPPLVDEEVRPIDDYYFDGYSHIGIHETMLRDAPRTLAYADFFRRNTDFVRGKVVLDVGCGTGILCMLAAQAGAKKVVGVDCSSIIHQARRIVQRNGYDSIITLVHGKLEDLVLPVGCGDVDIIVSEWMGYGLYFENMLNSVLHARDVYLAEDGVVMPNIAKLFVEACTVTDDFDPIRWWKDVYSFDMSDMQELVYREAQVQFASAKDSISSRATIHDIDIGVVTDDELDFTSPFSLNISRDAQLRGLVISFDVLFARIANEIVLSTCMDAAPTHWKQTVLYFENHFCLDVVSGDVLTGTIKYERAVKNKRDYIITIECKHDRLGITTTQKYNLSA